MASAVCSSLVAGLQRKATVTVPSRTRVVTVYAKSGGKRRGPMGYVPEDNSGKGNIFAVEPKTLYTNSPTSDRAARQGLGGQQGLLIVGGIIAVIGLVTAGEGLFPAETVEKVAAASSSAETLSAIAARIQASL